MKQIKKNVLKPREIFEAVRRQRNDRFSLRVKLTLMVSAELVLSALVAAGTAALLGPHLETDTSVVLMLSLIITSLVIGSVATSLTSRYFFDPIRKLAKAMEQIADGDFTVRLEDHSSSKEIMEVYTGFNMMAHELSATEMLQSDFVSNVSHEFKTPINAIEGYSMLLQGSDHLSKEQNRYVEKILFNTQRLSSLVSSILLLSRLENQQIQKNQTTYRLDEQIRQSIVAKEPEWAGKEVEFDIDLEALDYTGNEPMMRHVWDNLIGNAIKFGPDHGLIRMGLKQEEGSILFTIDDDGPGLDPDAMRHIYDKFYQADHSHREEGNGLGLALVKRILALENGTIMAENLDRGGCRFTVMLKGGS